VNLVSTAKVKKMKKEKNMRFASVLGVIVSLPQILSQSSFGASF
jgi:hypothetical protein